MQIIRKNSSQSGTKEIKFRFGCTFMHLRAVHGKIPKRQLFKGNGGRIECAGHVIRQKQQIRRIGGDNLLNFAGVFLHFDREEWLYGGEAVLLNNIGNSPDTFF